MASESVTFDFIGRGADNLAKDFRKVGDNAAAAAKGADTLKGKLAGLDKAQVPDFLDTTVPTGRLAQQAGLIRRLLEQNKVTDFLGTSMSTGKIQQQMSVLRRLLSQNKVADFLDVSVSTGKASEAVAGLATDLAALPDTTTAAVSVTTDTAALRDLKARLAALKTGLTSITVGVDDTPALAKLTALQARANGLGRTVEKLRVDADTTPALAKLLALKVEADKLTASMSSAGTGGGGGLIGGLLGRLGGGGAATGGGAGGAGGLASGTAGGIGPGITGVSAKSASIVGLVGSALATLPALAGIAGTGIGVALIGGIVGVVSKGAISAVQPAVQAFTALQNAAPGKAQTAALKNYQAALAQLTPAQRGLAKAIESVQTSWQNFVQSNTAGVATIIKEGAGLLPGIFAGMSSVFQAVVPQMKSIFANLGGLIAQVFTLIKAAVPAFAPVVNGIISLISGILPGITAAIRAMQPFLGQFAGILATLGKNIGGFFAAAAPAIGASMKVLGALLDLVGALLPIIMQVAGVFATTLAPIFSQLAGVIKALTPFLVTVGKILASLAGAVLGDLSGAFGALATFLTDIAPALGQFATVLSGVFTTLENSGVFAALGDALENIAPLLAGMVTQLLNGLTPVLPALVKGLSAMAGIMIAALSSGLAAIIPPLTQLALVIMAALVKALPVVLPVLGKIFAVFTTATADAIAAIAGGLANMIGAIPKPALDTLVGVATALLILKKTGVISLGFKLVGIAQKLWAWLTGGTVDVAAGGMQSAADTMTAAAAAMQKAADTMAGGTVKTAAAGAAGGAATAGEGAGAAGGLSGILAAAGAAAGPVFAGAFIGAALKALGDKLSPKGTFAGQLNSMFQGLSGPISSSVFHAFTFGGLEGWLTAKIGQPVGAVENNILAGAAIWGGNIDSSFSGTWSNVEGGAKIWGRNISGSISGTWSAIEGGAKLWGSNIAAGISGTWSNVEGGAKIWGSNIGRSVSGSFSNILGGAAIWGRNIISGVSGTWNTVWSNTSSAVSRGAANVVSWFRGLPGRVLSAMAPLVNDMSGLGTWALAGLESGAKSVVGGITSFFSSFASGIVSVFKKIWGWFSPSSVMYEGGKSLMTGLAAGIKDHAHLAVAHAKAAAAATLAFNQVAYSGTGGVAQWRPTVSQALSLAGSSQQLVDAVLYQMQTESGGNPTIVNRTDINWQEGHPSVGLMQVIAGTFAEYAGRFRSTGPFEYGVSVNPLANVYAAIKYAQANYGPGLRNAYGGIGTGHGYALGTASAAPGWAWVGERGPELMKLRGGEQIAPIRPRTGGGAPPVIFQISGGSGTFDAFLLKWLQEHVRVKGGGNVQAAFGRH